MSAYHDNFGYNNLPNLKMNATDSNCTNYMEPSNASPPDFDFNLPYGSFKSSFARSLSLNNTSNNSCSGQCKSLDYDMHSNNNNNNSNKLSFMNKETKIVPPIPQRRLSQAGLFHPTKTTTNEANKTETAIVEAEDQQPPALPARRPLSLHNLSLGPNVSVNSGHNNSKEECRANVEQQYMNDVDDNALLLTPLYANHSNNNNNISNGNNNNNKNHINHATGLQAQKKSHQHQQQQHQQFQLQYINNANGTSGSGGVYCNKNIIHNHNINNNNSKSSNINGCSSTCSGINNVNNCNGNNNNSVNNFRRNNIVWPHHQENVEQNCNLYNTNPIDDESDDVNNGVDLSSHCNDTTKLPAITDYNNHFNNSQQMMTMMITKQPTINQQQQQQQRQQLSKTYNEILNDNSTNVEAIILQNQMDTLQWQLKQVETSRDMYRAVMEEVVRFLERYQIQKQQQQQQQQQVVQQQRQETLATHKNKMEQIPRSKSLFQVYIAGGHDKSTTDKNNASDDGATTSLSSLASSSSKSYLRARSSSNLIDLKQQQPPNSVKDASTCSSKKKQQLGHSKDDHIFENPIASSQSCSAFKDLSWRRSPKNVDSQPNVVKDVEEEKLNQEAYRLLRTIQNLLNTSQHQPDLAHPQSGRLAKAISTTSVMTLPGAPLHNSTGLTTDTNSVGSSTPDSTMTSSPLTNLTATNTASHNNLAPEMIFLRTANIRDSRLSLRSSTDSSVHSTCSVASSASSKVETDEDATIRFHTPANLLNHKQHHHPNGSGTEDESGFSSISSFPELGIPLSSTLLSSKGGAADKDLKSETANDSRNSTLKANIVGLPPLNSLPDMSHRWDSPSKTYHNASNKFQRFSALTNEDANTVLWV